MKRRAALTVKLLEQRAQDVHAAEWRARREREARAAQIVGGRWNLLICPCRRRLGSRRDRCDQCGQLVRDPVEVRLTDAQALALYLEDGLAE